FPCTSFLRHSLPTRRSSDLASLHLEGATRRDLLGFDRPLDLEGSARLDSFRAQIPRDADGTCGPELLDLHVAFETTSARDARHFCDERTLNPGASGGPELDRPHGVPTPDAAPDDLDRFVA